MNYFWKKEYEEHQITRFERDNYLNRLKQSENERLTDVITGVPNSRSLEADIKSFSQPGNFTSQMQFILIDLKNFRLVNKKFGFLRASELLRAPDALGFCNRLVGQFKSLTEKTPEILGQEFPLSFHCAVVEIEPRDSIDDIIEKAGKCYRVATEGKKDFTLCWYPVNVEAGLQYDQKKQFEYLRARALFEVLSADDKKYY